MKQVLGLRAQQISVETPIGCTIWLLLRARLDELWTWDVQCRGFFYEAPLDFGLHVFCLAHPGIPCFVFSSFSWRRWEGEVGVCGRGSLKISIFCPTSSALQTAESQPYAFYAQHCSCHLNRQFFCIHCKLHLLILLLMYFWRTTLC